MAEEVSIKNQRFVRLYFQLSNIYSLAAQRLADFSNAFFQNVLQGQAAKGGRITNLLAAMPIQPKMFQFRFKWLPVLFIG